MQKIINCTPHPISIINADGSIQANFPKGTIVPRLEQKTEIVGEINGIPVSETTFGEIENLPEQIPYTFYIVSRMVMSACPERNDLLVPNGIVRDENGNIIGSESLARN